MFLPATLGVAVALGAAACGGPATHSGTARLTTFHAAPTGRIVGTFFTEGGVAPGNIKHPVPGTVTIDPENGKAITVKVGRNGEFSAVVPVGSYSVSGRTPYLVQVSPSGKQTESTCYARTPTVVTAGHTTSVPVGCYIA